MALNSRELSSEFRRVLQRSRNTSDGVLKDMALAYQKYANGGMAGSARPVFVGREYEKIRSFLRPIVMSMATVNPYSISSAWGAGLSSFWLAPPVSFISKDGLFIGVVSFVNVPLVVPMITALYSKMNSVEEFSSRMASVLDVFTRSVIVMVTNTTTGVTVPLPLV